MIQFDLFSIFKSTGPFIANHLWQSTLFAVVAWMITLILKNNRARTRYWIWFAVSIKFLIPFSLIVSLGGLMAPEWNNAPAETSPGLGALRKIHQPFNTFKLPPPSQTLVSNNTSPTPVTSQSAADISIEGRYPVFSSESQTGMQGYYTSEALPGTKGAYFSSEKTLVTILILWLCGTIAVLLNWFRLRRGVARMVKKAMPITDRTAFRVFQRVIQEKGMPGNISLLVCIDSMEPGVFGIFRPVLLLPAGILEHINDREFETVLLHEFEHIRCRDNLIALIHTFVSALFWCHPVVWWTGSKLLSERELACDQAVLQSGKNNHAYAGMLLKVCEYYFKSPIESVSGVIGSNLKIRMEGIMKKPIENRLGFIKKSILSMAGLTAVCLPLAIGILYAPAGQAKYMENDLREINIDEVINKNQNTAHEKISEPLPNKTQDNSGAVSDRADTLRTEALNKPPYKNENPSIVMAHAEVTTAEKTGRIIESVNVLPKPIFKNNPEDGPILAQKESYEFNVSDAANITPTKTIKPKQKDAVQLENAVTVIKNGDFKKACELLLPLAENNNAQAQALLGTLYVNGQGVKKDITRGMSLIMKAAKQGFKPARVKAFNLNEILGKQGNTAAMFNAGYMCLKGWAGEQETDACLNRLQTAGKLGHQKASYMLARIYREGMFGVTPDEEKAAYWKNLATAISKGIDGKWEGVISFGVSSAGKMAVFSKYADSITDPDLTSPVTTSPDFPGLPSRTATYINPRLNYNSDGNHDYNPFIYESGPAIYNYTFEFKSNGDELTGQVFLSSIYNFNKYSRLTGKVESNNGSVEIAFKIKDGKIEGNKISFTVDPQNGGEKSKNAIKWTGRLRGDALSLNYYIKNILPNPLKFTARRAE